ncbi:hypothetical protein ABT187_38725 [Streptomyces sp. NPDC001817]|uniref:hypothetical protein n=1 Tax=Streptomyces sp. NPDC001817 TaxID=3154398 RepID=UPI00332DCAA8
MPPVIKIDESWVWRVLASYLPSDPTVWDPSSIPAAVARHASDVRMVPEQPEHDHAWRAAALLHTLTVCPPLESPMNEFFAMSTTYAYLSLAPDKPTVDRDLLADLVEAAQRGASVHDIAAQLREHT